MINKKTISVVIITHNEENHLPDCLSSVNWVDEIILLDSNSHDKTCKIAEKAGALVFQATNWRGFGIQRQHAQSYANSDYILMLDADERVTPLLRQSIEKILLYPTQNKVYSFARQNLFLGRFMRYSGWYPDYVIRLYDRKNYCYNSLPVHESLEIGKTTVAILEGNLKHITCNDLISFQKKQLKYAKIWAQEQYRQNSKCSLYSIITHSYNAFIKTWLFQAGFLDGKQGWLLAVVKAQYTFNKYTALWELNVHRK